MNTWELILAFVVFALGAVCAISFLLVIIWELVL